jgi:hypothetical protein
VYILIITMTMFSNGTPPQPLSVSVATAEFSTHQSCLDAAEHYKAVDGRPLARVAVTTSCNPK